MSTAWKGGHHTIARDASDKSPRLLHSNEGDVTVGQRLARGQKHSRLVCSERKGYAKTMLVACCIYLEQGPARASPCACVVNTRYMHIPCRGHPAHW